MDFPLVTVVTITYNSSRYVRDAIESVLAQTYTNIEYIIGDDCSTDNTWEIIQEYKDHRIKAYCNESNIGEYPNRNKAIDMAEGQYFIFIDGDDIIYPHGIGYFVSLMLSFPQAGMAIQKNYINNILYPAIFELENLLKNYFYGKINLISSSFASNFFKTELLKDGKLNSRYLSGDEEIRLRIATQQPILYVAGWVTWPRETPGQASSRIREDLRLIEAYQYTGDILFELAKGNIEIALLNDMNNVRKRRMARFALKLLWKGELNRLRKFILESRFPWKEIFRFYNYIPIYGDELNKYTPGNPFKKGFLNRL